MIKNVLFDLDGTLLGMDQDLFVKAYFGKMCMHMAHRFEPEKLVKAIWDATGAMVMNDGSQTNEEVFWKVFDHKLGMDTTSFRHEFDEYYENEFDSVVEQTCVPSPICAESIKLLKSKGYKVIVATNPIFPAIATRKRMIHGGFDPNDFELVTTYENCHYSKPNPKYYMEIMEKCGLDPAECMMVGNDCDEDMVATTLGMKFCLVTDDLINKHNKEITADFVGTREELYHYFEEMVNG